MDLAEILHRDRTLHFCGRRQGVPSGQPRIIIIIIKNECHSNIIVDRLQGCGHSKKLRESESESHSSKVV